MSRLPGKHKTLILRLKAATVAQLAMVAARESKDPEEIVEALLEREYSADGKTKQERIAELSRPLDDITADTEAEVARIVALSKRETR